MRTHKMTVALILLVFMAGCSHSELGDRVETESLRVRLAGVEKVVQPEQLRAPGQVSSLSDAYVSAKSMGTVLAIHAKSGDTVRKGQSMLDIDSSDIQSKLQQARGALAQAEAALAISENNYKRFQELYERKAASKVELEQMEYQYKTAAGAVEMARGAVQEAKSYLKFASVTAPFDGLVVERMINVGDFAAPGRPLFRLVDASSMEFVCQVSESDAEFVTAGVHVPVTLDTLGETIKGTVREVSAGSDFMTHSVRVHVDLPAVDGLKAGMYGVAEFPGVELSRILIPKSWVVQRGELQLVYVKGTDGRAHMRLIRTGKMSGDQVEVISGLDGTEQVVTDKLNRIQDGVKLEGF